MITKEELINLEGSFTWDFGQNFLIETAKGNFIWSDPDYQGSNKMIPFNGDYGNWCKHTGVPYGRDKGLHVIKSYCGEDFIYEV